MTSTTRPTSPAPFTTGMPTLMPSSLPLQMSMVWEKFDGLPESTRRRGGVDVADPLEVLLLEELGELLRRRPPRGPRRPSSLLELPAQLLVLGLEVAVVGDAVPRVGERLAHRLGRASQRGEDGARGAAGALHDRGVAEVEGEQARAT